MNTLTITRGYSGSGKTTLAKRLVAERTGLDRAPLVRVNRDDIRAMTGVPPRGDYRQGQQVTRLQRAMVRSALEAKADVIVDDTNLALRFARDWADLAAELAVDFEVIDVDTDPHTCIGRNRIRIAEGHRGVPQSVIESQARRFPASQWREVTAREAKPERAWTPYAPPSGPGFFEVIYLVDIDGTIAKKRQGPGERGWHDYGRVGEDRPNMGVVDVVTDLRCSGAKIVFMSGRKDYCREETRAWLQHYLGEWTAASPLFMRASDDNRSDDIVKHELFHEHIQGKYIVTAALDDRDRVVAMWRAIGLACLQVDLGDF